MPIRLAQHMLAWKNRATAQNLPFDVNAMLHDIAEAGFTGVELGGNAATLGTPIELRRKLEAHELEAAAFGANVTANPYPPNTDEYRDAMDYAVELGVKTIVVCGGFVPEMRRTMFESDYQLFAENLGAAITYAQQRGLLVTFHPHIGCLVETIAEVQELWRYLPDLDLCIDTGHLASVRENPLDLLKLKPEQVRHFHLKDWNAQARQFVPLGEGDQNLDFTHLLQTLKRMDYDGWLAVELDIPQAPIDEIATASRRFLRACEAEAMEM